MYKVDDNSFILQHQVKWRKLQMKTDEC